MVRRKYEDTEEGERQKKKRDGGGLNTSVHGCGTFLLSSH